VSRIAAVRFKAYGCAATIAAASALTEMLAGRTLQEAAAIDEAAIVSALDGLPPRRLHAVGLALQALAELLRAGK
jgi:NifU-like protein involved in Fe-S cluster formation